MYIAEDLTPCQVHDSTIWFSDHDTSKRTRTAKALCRVCPERFQCLASTLRYEKREGSVPGVYGGLTQNERRERVAAIVEPPDSLPEQASA